MYIQYMALRHSFFLLCYQGRIPQRRTDSYLRLIYVFLAVLMSGFLLVMSNTRPGGGGGLGLLGQYILSPPPPICTPSCSLHSQFHAPYLILSHFESRWTP